MLGRLNMSVEECQQAYTTLAEEVFGKPNNILAFRDGIFNAKTLEEVITRIVIKKKLETKMMNSPDQRCKVFVSDSKVVESLAEFFRFVCACPAADPGGCRLFRTYDHDSIKDDCEIWEAARATSAAPKYFKRAEVMTQVGIKEAFIDGGFGWNNPAKKLCDEARARFPSRKIDCIISIGSGTNPGNILPQPKWWQKRIAVHVIPTLIKITTDCRRTHDDMSSTFRDLPNTYFRFDVEGLGQLGLEEWKLMPVIRTKTLGYLEGDEINTRVNMAVNVLYASQRKQETTPNG
jgi:predicted acylesterase/phospholipase RssA